MTRERLSQIVESFGEFLDIIARLRSPGGCPWDRDQTPASMRSHLIEEVYETIEAIDDEDPSHVREELGDVLLIIAMLTRMYAEREDFDMLDVVSDISNKLIRRHPHVFGDENFKNADEVLVNWEKIKTNVEGRNKSPSAMDGIPASLPPLERSYRIQKRAAKQGFDWPDATGARAKIAEELQEVDELLKSTSSHQPSLEEEIGDLLFSVVNYSRHLKIDPTLALNKSNAKFEKRFRLVDTQMSQDGKTMSPENLSTMDMYWENAKKTLDLSDGPD